MLKPKIADGFAAANPCRAGCGKIINPGDVVLHLKLGSNFNFDNRNHYFHLSCMAETVTEAEELLPTVGDAGAWIAEVREKMIATGEFLVDV